MTNTNEQGRSMVEMLGVLAIIGVLSIGGIAGYTTAMNKYRANEIAQAVAMTVIQAKVKAANGGGAASYKADIGDLPSSISSIVQNNGICASADGESGTYTIDWNTGAGGVSAVQTAFSGTLNASGEIGGYTYLAGNCN